MCLLAARSGKKLIKYFVLPLTPKKVKWTSFVTKKRANVSWNFNRLANNHVRLQLDVMFDVRRMTDDGFYQPEDAVLIELKTTQCKHTLRLEPERDLANDIGNSCSSLSFLFFI